jgi:hypothetical protein
MAAEAKPEVWIGLVEVVPDEGQDPFDGALGAYANVLALARSVKDYMEATAAALLREGLLAVRVDDLEPLRERRGRFQLNDEILDLGEQAKRGDVVWDTFYAFDNESDE